MPFGTIVNNIHQNKIFFQNPPFYCGQLCGNLLLLEELKLAGRVAEYIKQNKLQNDFGGLEDDDNGNKLMDHLKSLPLSAIAPKLEVLKTLVSGLVNQKI